MATARGGPQEVQHCLNQCMSTRVNTDIKKQENQEKQEKQTRTHESHEGKEPKRQALENSFVLESPVGETGVAGQLTCSLRTNRCCEADPVPSVLLWPDART